MGHKDPLFKRSVPFGQQKRVISDMESKIPASITDPAEKAFMIWILRRLDRIEEAQRINADKQKIYDVAMRFLDGMERKRGLMSWIKFQLWEDNGELVESDFKEGLSER